MSIKKYLKRVLRYLFRGVPNVEVKVDVSQVVTGNMLYHKNILITGGGRGLGYAMAVRFISEGANVIITGRNEELLINACNQLGNRAQYICFDSEEIKNIEKLFDNVSSIVKHLDCLVLNAGVSFHEKNILGVSIENYERQMRINLEAYYFMAKEFIKRYNGENQNILMISSERSFQCDDIPYGLTKASVNSLTRGLSRRFYKNGFRVNAIAPGITTTDMTGRKASDNLFAEEQAAGRFFIPEEVAEVALFLLSDASKCISGEIIACDAGQYISAYYE